MKISIAKTAGFCMGVRRAVEMVLDTPSKYRGPIYTYGPLIHNPQVLELLAEKGISVLNQIPHSGSGTVLIRAHGVPPQTLGELEQAGFAVIDATCPRVIKVQSIIKTHTRKGYAAIIVGDGDHPEVVGLLGCAHGRGHVAGDLEALQQLPHFDRAIIVAQTTQNTRFFDTVKIWAGEHYPHYKIFDTICDSTLRRQAEVKSMARQVDALVVVGGHNSGNTQRLAEIGRQAAIATYHIEAEQELESVPLAGAGHIGITAGASTPNWVINRVIRAIEKVPLKRGRFWRKALYMVQRALLMTNIYLALGAGCLCFACANLQGIYPYKPQVLIAMAYVLSMHILNNLIGTKADRFNDPARAYYYRKHKTFLTVFAVAAGAYGLATAFTMGPAPFLVLLQMSVLGLSYNFKIIPRSLSNGRYRRPRDLPGSKTVLIAVAWGVVTALFPYLSTSGVFRLNTVVVFLMATVLVFVSTAFFDILDMQGDRIVGKETIPLVFGEKRTMTFLKTLLIVTVVVLCVAVSIEVSPPLALALTACPLLLYVTLSAHEQGYTLPGFRLVFLVESHFILAGIITMIRSLIPD